MESALPLPALAAFLMHLMDRYMYMCHIYVNLCVPGYVSKSIDYRQALLAKYTFIDACMGLVHWRE